jgi:RNA polymerase sigma-70 factor, ECF subfamily
VEGRLDAGKPNKTCNFSAFRSVYVPLTADPDQRLVDRSRQGDLRAFEALVHRHRMVVLRVAARVVGEDDADDVAQDAFLRAFHRLDRFRGDAPFRSWLLSIAYNAALTSARRREMAPTDSLEDQRADAVTDRTPAEELELRERLRRLDLKLKGLSPEHRIVLVLRDVEGLTYDEIALVTDAPLGSVKARLHRARHALIHLLRTNAYDWELPA